MQEKRKQRKEWMGAKLLEQLPQKTPAKTAHVNTVANLKNAIADMLAVKSRAELEKVWYGNPAMQNDKEFVNACMNMGKIYPAQ